MFLFFFLRTRLDELRMFLENETWAVGEPRACLLASLAGEEKLSVARGLCKNRRKSTRLTQLSESGLCSEAE